MHSADVELIERLDRKFYKLEEELFELWMVFVARYGTDGSIDWIEANRALTTQEKQELTWEVNNFVEDMEGALTALTDDEIDGYRLKNMDSTRLNALKAKARMRIRLLYKEIEQDLTDLLVGQYKDVYYQSAYETFKTTGVAKKINKLKDDEVFFLLFMMSWRPDELTYSDYLKNQMLFLMADIASAYTQASTIESDYTFVQDRIDALIGTRRNSASGAVRTDSDFFRAEAQRKVFTDLNIKSVIFTAVLDERTSEMCREMHGTVIPIDDLIPGENCPPLHPNCRSTLTPNFDDLPEYLEEDCYDMPDVAYEDFDF